MVDVTRMPDNSFGYVPTPAIVAPIEFSMALNDYQRLGGHMDCVRTLDDIVKTERHRIIDWVDHASPWPLAQKPMLG